MTNSSMSTNPDQEEHSEHLPHEEQGEPLPHEAAQMFTYADYMSSLSHLRCRLDVMDMNPLISSQQQLDTDYKHMLIYQDDASKFTCLKPLRTADASAISAAMVDIFCELGSTLIISTRRHGFSAEVTREIRRQWPGCFVVVGKTASENDLSRFETCRDRVKQAMTHWMDEKRNQTWSQGTRFVQWELNTSCNENINERSQVAMLNEQVLLNLSGQLDCNVVEFLDTEEDLVNAFIAHTS